MRHRCKAKPPAYDGSLAAKEITTDKRADFVNEKWPENLHAQLRTGDDPGLGLGLGLGSGISDHIGLSSSLLILKCTKNKSDFLVVFTLHLISTFRTNTALPTSSPHH